jgi:hypothetical protein
MNYMDIKPNQTEEENILICDVSDEALEAAADTERENAERLHGITAPPD